MLRTILVATGAVTILAVASARGMTPAPRPKLSVFSNGTGLGLSFKTIRDPCDLAPTPLALKIKDRSAGRWSVSRLSDQFKGKWSSKSDAQYTFYMTPYWDSRQVVFFEESGTYDYKLLQDGKPILAGWVRVNGHLHDIPARVYEYFPDGSVDDTCWNYCIRQGKQIFSAEHGNLCCNIPGDGTDVNFQGWLKVHPVIGGHGG